MYLLGMMATLVSGQSDPAGLILQLMGNIGLAVPALVLVVFSTITSDFPDIYSATCSMLNISQKISAKTIMWIAGILSILVALVFPAEKYESFLFLIGAMFVPLFGVVLTDYFIIRRRKLDLEAIYQVGGSYWYTSGFNIVALIAWAAGFTVYKLIELNKLSIGASIPSLVAAGLIYYILAKWQRNRRRA
jgi:purine-cytosine permease-like protein